MSELTLEKLFHSDYAKFKEVYEKRFNDPETIHLNIMIGEYPAFIRQTVKMYKSIVSAERTNNKVNMLCTKLPPIAHHHFINRCLVDEIVLTNDIEGVNSTRREINEVLMELSHKDKRERFVGLVKKFIRLSENENIPLDSCMDIRRIYDDIFFDEINSNDPENLPDGKIFRKDSVGVYSAAQKEIHKGLYPESKIIDVMEKSLEFLKNDNIDILIRIAVFHYLFGYIHPFYDGNGRTDRFISSYLLSKALNPMIGFRLSYTVKENISGYYKAFKVCNSPNNRGELTPFAEMFLDVVDTSMTQLHEALESRYIKMKHYHKIIGKLPSSDLKGMSDLYYCLIQASLFSDHGISLSELENELKISCTTLWNRLKKIPKEMLSEKKISRQKFYSIVLEELDKEFEKQ